jgi:hypothetical protein
MHQQIEGLGLGRYLQEPIIHKAPLGEFLTKIACHSNEGVAIGGPIRIAQLEPLPLHGLIDHQDFNFDLDWNHGKGPNYNKDQSPINLFNGGRMTPRGGERGGGRGWGVSHGNIFLGMKAQHKVHLIASFK